MPKHLLPLACLALAPAFAVADEPVADVQVSFYQSGLHSGCKSAGLRSGAPEDQAEAFCDCLLKTLRSEMSLDEWQAAYAYASRHESESEMRILAPHMQKVGACLGQGG